MNLITSVLVIQYGLILSLAFFVFKLYRQVRELKLKPQTAVAGHEEPAVPKEGLELGFLRVQTVSPGSGVEVEAADSRGRA